MRPIQRAPRAVGIRSAVVTGPDVSIVTPSYNQGQFIRDTLESVRRQRHVAVEHLVMDGGSTDGTIDILEEYADRYDLWWRSEPDDGQSAAINEGFDRATGDIVAWLNSDDVYFHVDVLDHVIEAFDRSTADVIYGDLAYLDERSRIARIDVRPDFDAAKLPYRILIGQPAAFFRREVVEAERLDTDLQYSMDYEYWLRLARQFTFRHVDEVFAGFRTYESQKSHDQGAMADELQGILTDYRSRRGRTATVLDNLRTEADRYARTLWRTYRLKRNPPMLAFDGRMAPFHELLLNAGPGVDDVRKAVRRVRSGGASG